MVVRIPKTFYLDHVDRDLVAPPVLKATKRHFWIETDHEDMPELVSDADFYADAYGPETPNLRTAARALLRAIPEDVLNDIRRRPVIEHPSEEHWRRMEEIWRALGV